MIHRSHSTLLASAPRAIKACSHFHSGTGFFAGILVAWVFASCSVNAQTFPARPIKMMIPFAAGGSVDAFARVVAEKLAIAMGQPVVAENRLGANGTIAHQSVATAAPDGYTIGMSGTSPLVLAPHQFKSLPYNSLKDFVYLSCAGTSPFVLDVAQSVPAKTIDELVTYAKANPGKLNFGSAGIGNSAHLAGELFKQVSGTHMTHIPYKGNALAMADLAGGQIQVLFDPIQTSLPQIRGGKVRALGVTSNTRFAELPDVPTIAESGYPSFEFVVWYAFIAPAATPAPIVARLNSEINKILRNPEMKSRFAAMGTNLTESTTTGCAGYIRNEYVKWGKLMSDVGIKPE